MGGLVAVPVICGVGLAALTVAAPAYGVYRLVRHVRRRREIQLDDYNFDDDVWYTDIDMFDEWDD